MTTRDEIENIFSYHPPFTGQPERYIEIRQLAKEFALRLEELCPPSDERKDAIRHIDYAVMRANAAIARHEKEEQ